MSVSSLDVEAEATSNYIQLSVLPSGSLTLPEHFFCADQHDKNIRNTVPSMSFLLYHPRCGEYIIFDLGMRRDLTSYPADIQPHLRTRLPIETIPDTRDSLLQGGLSPSQIGTIILSHVHYDHVGTPSDFLNAQFIVGYGTRHLLANGMKYHSAAHFEKDLLPPGRTTELPIPDELSNHDLPIGSSFYGSSGFKNAQFAWKNLHPFPNTIDLFGDKLLYIIDSPGHLAGHINVLARVAETQWIYLAGDACHHSRILSGETDMASWSEGGQTVCIHVDKGLAMETLQRIRGIREQGFGGAKVEVILAHDAEWLESHQDAIWPGRFQVSGKFIASKGQYLEEEI